MEIDAHDLPLFIKGLYIHLYVNSEERIYFSSDALENINTALHLLDPKIKMGYSFTNIHLSSYQCIPKVQEHSCFFAAPQNVPVFSM